MQQDQALERLQVVAVGRAGTPTSYAPRKRSENSRFEVAGLVDQHDIAPAHQAPCHHVHRLAGTVGQQHLLGAERDLLLGQQVAHELAQQRSPLGSP